MIRPWTLEGQTHLADAHIFQLKRESWRSPKDGQPYDFSIVDSHDWVNVIALTDAGKVVMVRQFRVGTRAVTLEIPGGGVEPGEDALTGARRELLEETGYEAERWTSLGFVEPNPAMQNNRCYSFLAEGARRVGEPQPDVREDLEVEERELSEIPGLLLSGEITHVLVAHAFHRLALLGHARAAAPG